MNNWLGEKINRAGGRKGAGKGQGVPERSWEFTVASLSSLHYITLHLQQVKEMQSHLQAMALHQCTLSVMLFGVVFFSFICILSYCVFRVLWMIQTQLSPGPFWAICFCEPLSNTATLCCLLHCFSFSGRLFALTNWTIWLCSLSVEKQPYAGLLRWSLFWSCDQNYCIVDITRHLFGPRLLLIQVCTNNTTDPRQGVLTRLFYMDKSASGGNDVYT